MQHRYDYVIVGGGSAGCVMAHRLSADPTVRVLLIEAGIDTPPGGVPEAILDSYPMGLFHGDRYIWPGLRVKVTEGRDGQANVRAYEQGRVMGGSSSINVQAANRGLPRDYDEWAALGASGWAWGDVLPYFRKLERDLNFDGPLHGRDGPVPIRRIGAQDFPPFARAVAEALGASGLSLRTDQNGDFEDGLFPAACSNENDRRVSAAAAYLDNATRARPNLSIWAECRVIGMRMAGRRASEVEVLRDAVRLSVSAGQVVLTAGALQTPALLMRAGIGPGARLATLGIQVIADRPGVGQNLRDHPALTLCQYLPRALRLPMTQRRASFVAMRYSSGLAGGSASDMYVTASARAGWHALGQRLGLYFMWCNRPHSHGSLTLASPDADTYPNIDLNLLSDPRDVTRMMACVRHLVRWVVTPGINANPDDLFPAAFTPRIKKLSLVSPSNAVLNRLLGAMLDVPAALRRPVLRTFMSNGRSLSDIATDDGRLEDFVRRNVFGVWHASGTCRMGRADDPLAVTDPSGKVIGTDNLYVADASVMPRLPTANTNIPTIMIAEKIAEGLRARH
ncbi:MAG: GMC oxidoreductase [Pseudomonadota bacterium]